jgi:hypothetical protein
MSHRSHAPLDALSNADIDALKSLWTKTFRFSPPASAKRDFLIRLLAYGLQERAHGALSPSTAKQLQTLGTPTLDREGAARATAEAPPPVRLGARLVRGWRGATHEVTVIDRGFAYRGTTYRSLSEIAQLITGAHWSGPRFFGIKALDTKRRRTHDQPA